MLRHRPETFAGLLVLCQLAGCGVGTSPSPPPPAAAPAGPPPTVAPAAAQPVAPAPAPGQPGTVSTVAKSARSRPLPDSPESHRFEIGMDIPNFELVPSADPRSGAHVALVEPTIGLDSTTVTLVDPGPPEGSGAELRPTAAGGAPAGFRVVVEDGLAEDGYPQRLRCEKDGSEMVRVPGGLSLQGRDGADPNAAPLHPVELSGFYIDVHEVTLGQYGTFYQETRPLPGRAKNHGGAAELPAVGITWRDASAYLAWVGKELPTEAEWEKAARGPNQFLYPWGDGRVLWHRPRAPQQIDPVGSFPADRSVYGVLDMAGNAREWCADFYADDAYTQAAGTGGTVVTDWRGPKSASTPGHRVVRGNAPDWQLWHRSSAAMLAPTDDLGFRGVLRWPRPGGADTSAGEGRQPPPSATPRRGREK